MEAHIKHQLSERTLNELAYEIIKAEEQGIACPYTHTICIGTLSEQTDIPVACLYTQIKEHVEQLKKRIKNNA